MRCRWIAFFVGGLLAAEAAATVRVDVGDTRAAGSSRLLYRETHYVVSGATPERWVLYQCPDGRPFARKHVRGGGAAPDFALEDGRDGYREGVRTASAQRIAYAGEADALRSADLSPAADAVIDAGFDVAVRTRWRDLMAGEAVRLPFLVPSRQDFLTVRVQRVGATTWNGQPAERLRMRLDAWYGFAVPDVDLVYAREDQRLLEFDGTGNVRDARGNNPHVRISFTQPRRTVTVDELAAQRRLPLDGRCPF